ncbi:transposase [Streptomyces acidiscabies]|uniref:Transposase n=1 Tax=Streptomyces acidiscabies TaxID=42234 RepID=A0ABU4LW67_9ACTN|nr:transposase [Streptomyces acidiscabies]MDX3020006.1 transposase [Streptomyces acidiscabies]
MAVELPAGDTGDLTVLGDSAYGTGDLRVHLEKQGYRAVIKPAAKRQAVPGGFTIDDFLIDITAGTATCPGGHTVNLGRPQPNGVRTAQFKKGCPTCPLRDRCTTSKTKRLLNVHPQYEVLAAARRQAATDEDWQAEYRRWRPPVERAIAWLVAGGNRRVPYRGVLKNDTWLHHRAAALNLCRLINLGLTHTADTWTIKVATPDSRAQPVPKPQLTRRQQTTARWCRWASRAPRIPW